MVTSCNHFQMMRIAIGLLVAVLSMVDHRPAWGIEKAAPKVTFTTGITSANMPLDDIDRVSFSQKELFFHVQWSNYFKGPERPLISYVLYDGAGNVAQKGRQRAAPSGGIFNWADSIKLYEFIQKPGMWKLEISVDRKKVAEKYVNVAATATIEFLTKKFDREDYGFKFWYPDNWTILKEDISDDMKQVAIRTKPKSVCGFFAIESPTTKLSDAEIKARIALLDDVSRKDMTFSGMRSRLLKSAGERETNLLLDPKFWQNLMGMRKMVFIKSEIVKTSDGNQTLILANIHKIPDKTNKRVTAILRATFKQERIIAMTCASLTPNFAQQKTTFQKILDSFTYR